MRPLLRAELLKLRTTRTFAALVAAAAGVSLLVVVLYVLLSSGFDEEDVRDLFTSDFTGLFILLLGVMGMAGEWRHRTITSTVLAAPDRVRLVAAKMLSYAVAGAVLSLLVTVTIMAVGSLLLTVRDEPTIGVADLADVLWRNLAVAALLGALGVAIGGIVRNQVAAIIGVFVFSFAVEPALIGLATEVGRFAPLQGAPSGIIAVDSFEDADELLAPGVAVLVMLGWLLAGFTATAALLRRRDVV